MKCTFELNVMFDLDGTTVTCNNGKTKLGYKGDNWKIK